MNLKPLAKFLSVFLMFALMTLPGKMGLGQGYTLEPDFGRFNEPAYISKDHSGNFLVTGGNDYLAYRANKQGVVIQVFRPNMPVGQILELPDLSVVMILSPNWYTTEANLFSSTGQKIGPLPIPTRPKFRVNSDGTINYGFTSMTLDGTVVSTYPISGNDFAFDSNGNGYFQNGYINWLNPWWDNAHVDKYDKDGNFQYTLPNSGDGICVYVDKNDFVYVGFARSGQVTKYDKNGNIVCVLPLPQYGPAQTSAPNDLLVDDDGTVYMCDPSNHRILRWSYDGSAPVSSLTVTPDVQSWSIKPVVVSITASDVGKGVKDIHYILDNQPEVVVAGSSTSFIVDQEGAHSITYWSSDVTGNIEAARTKNFSLDFTAPTSTITRQPGSIVVNASDQFSGVARTWIQINQGQPQLYSGAIPDTLHKITYWSEDVAGNVETKKSEVVLPSVVSINVSQPFVHGGVGIVGEVVLDAIAGIGGQSVSLTSSDPNVIVPQTVMVPEGATTASFDIDALPVNVNKSVTITGSANGDSTSTIITLLAPTMNSLSVNPTSVNGGTTITGNVSIVGMAPVGGTVIALGSSSLSVIPPTQVIVPQGQSSVSFQVSSSVVSSDSVAIISASTNGTKLKSTLSILGPKVASVTLAASSVVSLGTTTGTVTLSTNAPVGGKVVTLSSSNASVASVPVSVTVPAGTNSASFTITAGSVNASSTATITASTNGSNGTAILTVNPPPAALSGITTSVSAVTGGLAVTGTVNITSPAPTGGAVIVLASSPTTAGIVPASITIAAGLTSATFTITTKTVTASTALTITGSYLGVAKVATLTVNPARVVSILVLNPTTVKGGTNSTGTITLTGIATENVVVSLTSGTTTAATVPTSVTVLAGSSTATFTITTLAQTATKTSIITAKTGTTSKTATLSVTK